MLRERQSFELRLVSENQKLKSLQEEMTLSHSKLQTLIEEEKVLRHDKQNLADEVKTLKSELVKKGSTHRVLNRAFDEFKELKRKWERSHAAQMQMQTESKSVV